MKTRFSQEQLAAIDTAGNVIVSAGAGSGKTTVMVERIVKKLVAGSSLDKMLIVTFTRASAADIRVKLAERLVRLKREGGENERAAAERASESLPVCCIGTLHSFCQKLIRSYYYAADVDPAATLADENEARLLLLDCIRRAVRDARDRGDNIIRAALDSLSGRRDDEGAVAAIENVLYFALSLSDTRGYLESVDDDETAYPALDRMMSTRRDALIAEIRLLVADIAAAKFASIERAANELFGYVEHGFEVSGTSYRGKDQTCIALNERFKALKKKCSAYRADLADVQTAKGLESAPYARAVCAVALDALSLYEARKKALGKIDYSDLEHGALAVLKDDACMSEIAETTDYVFIDEYQDVNPLQAEIASLLKSGAHAEMFLVGDVKQSIYAFRRCNPKFFKDALKDPDYTTVLLNRNYRSALEVIEFVNNVFTGVMTDDFGGADYGVQSLVCGADSHGSAQYLCAREIATAGDGEGDRGARSDTYSVKNAVKGADNAGAQARLIVDLILEYAESGGRFDSVAVLVRSARTPFCDGLIGLMRENGIPCNLGKKSKAEDYPEAQALLKTARCVDNRFDDVALYTALRSPMGGFDDDELLEIATEGERRARELGVIPEYGFAADRKSYCFFQKVDAYVGRLSDRLEAFFARREKFAQFARSHDAADTLGKITSEIDFFQYVFETGGNPAAVEAVIALAAAKNLTLSAFLAQADGAELDVGDGGDAVTVTTVHASKGLEYDFVIVADTDKQFNMRDATEKCMAADGGVTVKYPDERARAIKPSARWLLEKYAVPDRLRAEELRLFYVALTRAKRKLVVCCDFRESDGERDKISRERDFMKNISPTPVTVTAREKSAPPVDRPVDGAVTEAVRERIAADEKYPFTDAPIKTCVTAIAADSDEDYTALAPVLTFDELDAGDGSGSNGSDGADGDAARRGTAYHRAMEVVDFDCPDEQKVREKTPDFDLVDFSDILTAVAEMKKLTQNAAAYYKERYFIADLSQSGGALVQGVIDLLIINADGSATIVDYKTTSPERLLDESYLTQLALYAAAVEKCSPFKVRDTYLYSFKLGRAVRARAIE